MCVSLAGGDFLNAPLDGVGRNSQSFADNGNSAASKLQRFLRGPMTALQLVQNLTEQSIFLTDFANRVFRIHGRVSDFFSGENLSPAFNRKP